MILRRSYVRSIHGEMHLHAWSPADAVRASATPLLCLHPAPDSGAYFDEFAAGIARDRLVMCPDLPGYGNSSRPPAPASIADHASAVAALLRASGYGRGGRGAVDVLGVGTGAAVATELAIASPDLAQRLVLTGLPYFDRAETRRRELEARVRDIEAAGDPERVGEAWLEYRGARAEGIEERRLQALFAERLRAGRAGAEAYRAASDWPGGERLSQLAQQVLLVAGGDAFHANTVAALARLRDGELVERQDLGAAAFHDRPDALVAIVRDWTARVCRC